MIFSSIYSDLNIAFYPKVIRDAINFLQITDFSTYADGEYEVRGRELFFQVRDINTKAANEMRPELHRKYIDIQLLFRGQERIGIVCDRGAKNRKGEVQRDLLEEKDVLFFKEVSGETFLDMAEGDFCIFFPGDIHRPACKKEMTSRIRKVVYKINIGLLE